MVGKLIFSLDLYVNELIYNNCIQFEMGFKTLNVLVNGVSLADVIAEGEVDTPLVDIIMVAGTDILKPKSRITITSISTVSSPREEEKSKSPIRDAQVQLVWTRDRVLWSYLRAKIKGRTF